MWLSEKDTSTCNLALPLTNGRLRSDHWGEVIACRVHGLKHPGQRLIMTLNDPQEPCVCVGPWLPVWAPKLAEPWVMNHQWWPCYYYLRMSPNTILLKKQICSLPIWEFFNLRIWEFFEQFIQMSSCSLFSLHVCKSEKKISMKTSLYFFGFSSEEDWHSVSLKLNFHWKALNIFISPPNLSSASFIPNDNSYSFY